MTIPLSKIRRPGLAWVGRYLGALLDHAGRWQALLVVCAIGLVAQAQSGMSEYAVEAAYLFDFGKFVRFAPVDGAGVKPPTFDICIVGEDPLKHSLDDLTAHEKLDGKPVRVVRLKSAVDAKGCSIAYWSASEDGRIRRDLDSMRGAQVLTVSDAPDFLREGGTIQFVTEGNHVRFSVNLAAAQQAHLRLSSELLKVALSVQEKRSKGVRP